MLTDRELRSEFEAALEAVTPPAPWLSTSIEKAWRSAERSNRRSRAPWLGINHRLRHLTALAAAMLALAIVVTLVVGTRASRVGSPIPAGPGVSIPGLLKATPQCPSRFAGTAQMFSSTVGWAAEVSMPAGLVGPYRTSDGGSHWTDVAPPEIPDQTDFSLVGATQGPWQFLDGSDAWVVRIGGSAGVYADHVVVFSTADGGNTWRQSQPLQLTPAHPDDFIQAVICFTDRQVGFLAMGSGPLGQGRPDMTVSALYRTSDGGLHWQWISDPDVQARQSGLHCLFDAMAFSSSDDGWISGQCGVIFATNDGGATWILQDAGTVAYFFDSTHGVVEGPPFGSNSPSRYPIATSSDGGLTWVTRGVVPISNCIAVFVDLLHGWCIVNPGSVDPSAGTPTDAEIYRTVDGGHAWSLSTRMGTNGGWIALDFLSAKVGFLTTASLPSEASWKFFKTTDGGLTWKQVRSSVIG